MVMKVAVLGSGPGALAVAADMSCHGRATTLADFDDFRSNLEPVAANGAVTVTNDWHGPEPYPETYPVTVATDIPQAIHDADLIVIVVPCSAHDRWVDAIAPHVTADQTVLFLGEGSGAIVARRAIPPPTVIAEANTLPYLARPTGPGSVTAFRKLGGVLIATLPATPADTAHTTELIEDVWPYATATDTVWNTVLANYNAIDHAAAMIANAGTLQNHTGGMLLWGEGATPAVVNVIETVDNELLALRKALNSKEPRRYQDFLVAQGLAPDLGPGATLLDTVRASKLSVADGVVCAHGRRRPTPRAETPAKRPRANDAGQPTGDAGQRPGRRRRPRHPLYHRERALCAGAGVVAGRGHGRADPGGGRAGGQRLVDAGPGLPGRGPHAGHPGSRRAGHHRPDRLRPHRSVPVTGPDGPGPTGPGPTVTGPTRPRPDRPRPHRAPRRHRHPPRRRRHADHRRTSEHPRHHA